MRRFWPFGAVLGCALVSTASASNAPMLSASANLPLTTGTIVAQATPSVPMPVIDAPASDLPAAVPTTPASPVAGDPAGQATAGSRAQNRQVVFTLKQLGAPGPLAMRGASELQGVQFGIRSDEVVTGAKLKLNGATSPSILPQFSNVTVTLNEQYVGTIPVVEGKPRFDDLEMTVDPVFFTGDNRLNFRFTGRYTEQCNDPLSGLLWSTVSDLSTLTLNLVRLPPQRDLNQLPGPFFDTHDRQASTLPFVVQANADNETLQATGVVASWFGSLTGYRGVTFPTASTVPGNGNAVVFATADNLPADLAAPHIDGPTIAVLANPKEASSSILLVAGRNGTELVAAAQALALGSRTLGGTVAAVTAPTLATRKPYDAPAWINMDGPVKFGDLVDPTDLQGAGFVSGTLRVPFRTAPDLYTWRDRGFPAEIRYRNPPGPIVDLAVSRLDVAINDLYLASMPLADDTTRRGAWWPKFLQRNEVRQVLNSGDTSSVRQIDVPPYDVFGQNELQLAFDTRPLSRGDCVGIPGDLRMGVDADSTIDLSRAHRIASLPNLAFFVNSGFPFTRMADLSETAVVLPPRPDPREIQSFLDLMGRMGAQTGYPALKLLVARSNDTSKVADRDLLLIGTYAHLQNVDLLSSSRFQVDGGQLKISMGSPIQNIRHTFGIDNRDDAAPIMGSLQTRPAASLATIVGTQSPLRSGRSVVALLAGGEDTLQSIVPMLRSPEQAAKVQGDLAVIGDGKPTSYRVGDTYTVGKLPFWLYPSWYFRNSPAGLIVILIIGTVLLGFVCFRTLRRRADARTRQIEA